MLIDGCMTKPFFSRNKEEQIIGTDIKATWHNESRGVMFIDNYHKKLQGYKEENEKD